MSKFAPIPAFPADKLGWLAAKFDEGRLRCPYKAAVAAYLLTRHNSKTGLVCPKAATIAEAIGASVSKVERVLRDLAAEAGGAEPIIARCKRFGRSTLYALVGLVKSEPKPPPADGGGPAGHRTGKSGTPYRTDRDTVPLLTLESITDEKEPRAREAAPAEGAAGADTARDRLRRAVAVGKCEVAAVGFVDSLKAFDLDADRLRVVAPTRDVADWCRENLLGYGRAAGMVLGSVEVELADDAPRCGRGAAPRTPGGGYDAEAGDKRRFRERYQRWLDNADNRGGLEPVGGNPRPPRRDWTPAIIPGGAPSGGR